MQATEVLIDYWLWCGTMAINDDSHYACRWRSTVSVPESIGRH